jgi:SecD/SecF fusion protein
MLPIFEKYLIRWQILAILVLSLILGAVALPDRYQPDFLFPEAVKNMKVVLGLDLQGGTQLDYKIDLRKVPADKHDEIISGVEEVITRRVNKLGVSEPNIYISDIGGEKHIIVELAGIKDIEDAKAKVGKTIQLEFKEQKAEPDPGELDKIRTQAADFLKKIQTVDATQFSSLAEEEAKAYPGKVSYTAGDFQFFDDISGETLKNKIRSANPGTIINEVIEDNNGFVFENNQLKEQKGLFIVQVLEKRNADKEINEPKEVTAQHILISYKDASRAEGQTRSKAEAEKLANQVLKEAQASGSNFDELAKKYSDEPGSETSLGKLTTPVVDGQSTYVAEFTDATLKLSKAGDITPQIVKTEFGYHIIKAVSVKDAIKETRQEPQVKFNQIFFSLSPDPWQATELTGEYFINANVQFDQFLNPQVSIQFNSEGATMFAEITERNIGKPVAIFVGGELISSPNVNDKITGGQAVITGRFTIEEAQELARDLNTGAIPAPITLAGQLSIGSTLGEASLSKSVTAGIIGVIVLSLWMIAYYRAPGLLAVLALGVYGLGMMFLVKSTLPVSLAILIGLTIGAGAIYLTLKNRFESTAEKVMSVFIAIFAIFFFTFLLREPIVMTLAGIAGVILSVGMAVDANILIFERIREEIKAGHDLPSSIEIGFRRAWSSIRDSNFSSLITCAILFYFGSSIIRGFALNLAAGIMISMFTAITITRTLLIAYSKLKVSNNSFLLGAKKTSKKTKKPFDIIGRSKIWFGISSVLVGISLISLLVQGLNFGIDFKGGTLMEIEFQKEVNKDQLISEFSKIDEKLTEIELGTPHIVTSTNETGNESQIVRFGYIDTQTHDQILSELKTIDPELKENRFTTIGPVIGDKLKTKALVAVLMAMIVIVLYIAFAFRKVPKSLGAWKFGLSAILALFHDVMITLGFFSLFQIEIDALFVTAILTVIGFSIHDTIVVFDRLRENLKEYKEDKDQFDDVANAAMNQTFARSINTSVSTLITLLALAIFGAESIFYFVVALIIGISVGTYSSIFIATPFLSFWRKHSK